MQHFLKPAPGAAGTGIIPAEPLEELLLPTPDRAIPALDPGFAQGTPDAACSSARRRACAQKESWVRLFFAIRTLLLEGTPNLELSLPRR